MNSFSSAVLSILLGWLRALFDNLWKVLHSESGGTFLSFLRFHWQTLFAGLCLGGFLLDRIVFFFRWRPDYVWSTRLNRLKRKLSRQDALQEVHEKGSAPASRGRQAAPAPRAEENPYAPPSRQEPFAPPRQAWEAASQAYEVPQATYVSPVAYTHAPYAPPASGPAGGFAPAQSSRQGAASPLSWDFAPMAGPGPEVAYPAQSFADVQPVFDDPGEVWTPAAPQLPVEAYQQPYENPARGLDNSFGTVRPEPEAYLRDVQAGFAPPPPPEILYPKPERLLPDKPGSGPVHPGLDLETFQQNIGLAAPKEAVPPEENALLQPLVTFPDTSYVSYYHQAQPDTPARSTGGLASLAKKAKELVRINDEDNPPTIRDLQPTASIKTSFHSPVLPKKPQEGGEE